MHSSKVNPTVSTCMCQFQIASDLGIYHCWCRMALVTRYNSQVYF